MDFHSSAAEKSAGEAVIVIEFDERGERKMGRMLRQEISIWIGAKSVENLP
jgi:hypothetical protein